MKKLLILPTVIAVLFSSCNKINVSDESSDNNILTVTANIEQFSADTKTFIYGDDEVIKPRWSSGDEIKLFNTAGDSAVYVVNSLDAGKTSASFTLKAGQTALTGTFACAYYPADKATGYSSGKITATIPSTQSFTQQPTKSSSGPDNKGTFEKGSFPMVGTGTIESGNLNLTFKNLFGILQINLSDGETESASVSVIKVFSGSALNGTATITPQASEEGVPSCTISGGTKCMTLSSSSPVSIYSDKNAKSFYLAVPAGITFTNVIVEGSMGAKLQGFNAENSVARSKILSMKSLIPDFMTPVYGYFTVGAGADGEAGTDDDVKVFFSPGNLKYNLKGTLIWDFFDNQYDCDPGTSSETTDEYVSLFCWGYNDDSTEKDHTSYISTHNTDGEQFDYAEDWGSKVLPSGVWRTLSGGESGEWKYLLSTRSVNGGTGEGNSYQRATINSDATGVYGLIIYPDNYTSQTSATSYTSSNWTAMESAGCVFLPAAGVRSSDSIIGRDEAGYYWSSTAYDKDCAYGLSFGNDFFYTASAKDYFPGTSYRVYACSVRLVTAVQ